MKEFIEIPFGAKDSELGGWEYNIPEGYTASIENGKIIVKKEENEDEKIRKELLDFFDADSFDCGLETEWRNGIKYKDILAWLEKKGEKIKLIENFDTEFEKQVSYLIASATNREYEYTEDFIKWAANGLLEYAKHEIEKQREQTPTDEEMKILLQTEYEKGKADAIEAAMESVTKDKESAIKFLKSAGIINESGELAEEYRLEKQDGQNSTWSEDDENTIKFLISHFCTCHPTRTFQFTINEVITHDELLRKIRHLKHQSTWKPSEEELNALDIAKDRNDKTGWHLCKLYKQLKKL